MAEEKDKEDNQNGVTVSDKNPLEWTVFGLGTLLTLLLIGYLAYMSATLEDKPPELLIYAKRDTTELRVLRYEVTITNNGTITAADVVVKVNLTVGDSIREEGEIIFPFVPHSSQREGWYQFTEVPSEGDSVKLQVISYRKP